MAYKLLNVYWGYLRLNAYHQPEMSPICIEQFVGHGDASRMLIPGWIQPALLPCFVQAGIKSAFWLPTCPFQQQPCTAQKDSFSAVQAALPLQYKLIQLVHIMEISVNTTPPSYQFGDS